MIERKKKKLKQREWGLFTVAVAPLTLVVVGLFCFKSSLPFSVEEIRPVRDFSFQVAQTVSVEEQEKLRVIFSQPFVYKGESDQCYLFCSQGGEYILKFFKMRKITPKYWLNYIPLPWLDQERLNKIGHRERARQELFTNVKTAYEEFRYQTNLFFVHFFNTNWLRTKLQIIDPQNVRRFVSLDSIPFVLQKRAIPVFEYIDDLIRKNKTKEAMSSLLLILDLVKDRCQRGFADQDRNLEMDYGFIGTRAVFIEVDKLVQDDSLKDPLSTLREVFKVSRKINDWLEKNHPSLVLEFQKESQDLISMLEDLQFNRANVDYLLIKKEI